MIQLPKREEGCGKRGQTKQKGSTDLFQYLQGFPTSPYCSAFNLDFSKRRQNKQADFCQVQTQVHIWKQKVLFKKKNCWHKGTTHETVTAVTESCCRNTGTEILTSGF